ncbi:unnamed protein product [Fraxinus pennsylvanica]|uniref:Glucose-6-phosphate dehydrogenase NAD-binding domain-containing protein n=1 Tax=Fraxinus pennsylvanica TaxID=56036 RepID=A0AAD2DSM3_9LAMI|nr:unnamed protein product [Fraxinus pennsylvanica]
MPLLKTTTRETTLRCCKRWRHRSELQEMMSSLSERRCHSDPRSVAVAYTMLCMILTFTVADLITLTAYSCPVLKDEELDNSKASHERRVFQGSPASISSNDYDGGKKSSSQPEGNSTYCQPSNASRVNVVAESPSYSFIQRAETSAPNFQFDKSTKTGASLTSPLSLRQTESFSSNYQDGRSLSLSSAVIGATGELARTKIFPALFALYYSGFLPETKTKTKTTKKKDPLRPEEKLKVDIDYLKAEAILITQTHSRLPLKRNPKSFARRFSFVDGFFDVD